MKSIACSKMWTDLYLNLYTKEIRSCCKTSGYKLSNDINSAYKADKVHFVKNNQLPDQCYVCKEEWPNALWQNWNEWKDKEWTDSELSDLPSKQLISTIGITLSPTCNMSCVYCNSDVSSTWAKIKNIPIVEDSARAQEVLELLYQFIETHVVTTDDRILYNLLGGEPLLDLRFNDVISNIVKLHRDHPRPDKPIYIGLVSNLNVKPKVIDNFLNTVRENQQVNWFIAVSVDTVEPIGGEIRDGLDISLLKSNLETILESKLFSYVEIIPTVSSLSFTYYGKMLYWIKELFKKHNLFDQFGTKWDIGTNTVVSPYELNPGTLPTSYVNYVDEFFDAIDDLPECKNKENLKTHFYNLKSMLGTRRSKSDITAIRAWVSNNSKLKSKDYYTVFPILKQITETEHEQTTI